MRKIRTLVVAAIAASALVVPAASASAAPAAGTCVAKGVMNLRDAIPGAAQAGQVSSIIQDHLRNPQNWEWCAD